MKTGRCPSKRVTTVTLPEVEDSGAQCEGRSNMSHERRKASCRGIQNTPLSRPKETVDARPARIEAGQIRWRHTTDPTLPDDSGGRITLETDAASVEEDSLRLLLIDSHRTMLT